MAPGPDSCVDALDEYDSDDDEEEYDEDGVFGHDGLLAADSSDGGADLDGDDLAYNRPRHANLRRGPIIRTGGSGDAFLDSFFAASNNTSSHFNSMAGRAVSGGDLLHHPLLGRAPDAPACGLQSPTVAGAQSLVDLALFHGSGPNGPVAPPPYLLKAGVGAPFAGNRELLHSPSSTTVPTFRRWAQAARLLLSSGPQSAQSSGFYVPVYAQIMQDLQAALLPAMQERRRKIEEERRKIQKEIDELKKKELEAAQEEEKKKRRENTDDDKGMETEIIVTTVVAPTPSGEEAPVDAESITPPPAAIVEPQGQIDSFDLSLLITAYYRLHGYGPGCGLFAGPAF